MRKLGLRSKNPGARGLGAKGYCPKLIKGGAIARYTREYLDYEKDYSLW